jgi:hypothetical protein
MKSYGNVMEKYDSSRFIKNITEFMPLFLQIYEEEDKNIKEIKRKKIPEINWSRQMLCFRKMLALFQKNALVSAQLPIDFDEKETVYETMNGTEKKGKCFPFFNRRKTLSFGYVAFFSLIGIQFSLTTFSDYCQTWEKQESEFLQSNTALVLNSF